MGTWLRIFLFVVIPCGMLVGAAEVGLALVLRQAARRFPIITRSRLAAGLTLMITVVVLAAVTTYAALRWVRFIKPFVVG